MSQQELAALVELLNRVPMTAGEKLWAQGFLDREVVKEKGKVAPVDKRADAGQSGAGVVSIDPEPIVEPAE